jgi:hypothetical protein
MHVWMFVSSAGSMSPASNALDTMLGSLLKVQLLCSVLCADVLRVTAC